MPNNQYDTIMGGNRPVPQQQQMPQMNWQDAMSQLRADPASLIKQARYNVPDEIANNPQTAAMYILQSGQANAPLMRLVQPLVNWMTRQR